MSNIESNIKTMATKPKKRAAKKSVKKYFGQGQVVLSRPDKTLKKFGVPGKVVLSPKDLK